MSGKLTASERPVADRYASEGWEVYHTGAPDFLLVKRDNGGDIVQVAFREIKSAGDQLEPSQAVWRDALLSLKLDYSVEEVGARTTVEFDDDVWEELVKRRAEHPVSIRRLMNEALRDGLAARREC